MLKTTIALDKSLTTFFFRLLPHNYFFNHFFSFFSFYGASVLIWLVILSLLIIFEEKRDLKFIIYFFVSITITFLLVNLGLKNIFHRLRPLTPYHCPHDYSFPSGHASLSFAAATVLAFYDKKRRWGYYFIATLIAYSRIYLECHYFFDVFGGAIIGYVISWLILKLKRFNRFVRLR